WHRGLPLRQGRIISRKIRRYPGDYAGPLSLPIGRQVALCRGRPWRIMAPSRFRQFRHWRLAMKHLALLSAFFVSCLAVPAAKAAVIAGAAIPDRPANNVQMIYNTNPAMQCYYTARDSTDLRYGLEHCDIAMRDASLNYRSQTVLNRGII